MFLYRLGRFYRAWLGPHDDMDAHSVRFVHYRYAYIVQREPDKGGFGLDRYVKSGNTVTLT